MILSLGTYQLEVFSITGLEALNFILDMILGGSMCTSLKTSKRKV